MRLLFIFISLFIVKTGDKTNSYREQQMAFTHVQEAYRTKEKNVLNLLKQNTIPRDSLRLYFRVFKSEKKIEMWGKNMADSGYHLLKEFPICEISGTIGPKRRSRDLQTPEGFYHLSDLNPYSKYFLSMKISYPNASDSIRGVQGHLGNLIYIHGGCESSGCIAITDERIKEFIIFCIEAFNSGQEEIGMTIFPAKLDDTNYSRLIHQYRNNKNVVALWTELKKGYDLFNQTKIPPQVKCLPDGSQEVY